jgi:hypothetical protein
VYVPQTDDGGAACRELAAPDDTTAVKARTGVSKGSSAGSGRPTDDSTIRKGSAMSVPADSAGDANDTRTVHPLSASTGQLGRWSALSPAGTTGQVGRWSA